MAEFTGFGPETVRFIAGLSADNSRAWFEANRDAYQAHYLTPAIGFVEAVAEPLARLVPGIRAEPRVNGSIFRINRDVRFSKDKRPYKDHLDLWFWQGERKGAISGLFFRLTSGRLILGAGAHAFTAPQLAAYRTALADPGNAGALVAVEDALRADGLALAGETYARPPREFAETDARLRELSRFKALHAFFDEPHPASLGSAAFLDHCLARWSSVAPVHRWLVAMA